MSTAKTKKSTEPKIEKATTPDITHEPNQGDTPPSAEAHKALKNAEKLQENARTDVRGIAKPAGTLNDSDANAETLEV